MCSYNKSRFIYLIPLLVLLSIKCAKVAADDDDDDDMLGELVIDLLIGIAGAACETSATCSAVMGTICMIVIVISIIIWMIEGCKCNCQYPTGRHVRRAGGMGLGYGIGRSMFRRR
jgi:hypothetical protein